MIVTIVIESYQELPARQLICDKCGHGDNIKGGPVFNSDRTECYATPLYCFIHKDIQE
jgi:hypothetical protein